MLAFVHWVLQLVALVAGLGLLIVGLVRKSKVMLIIGVILLLLFLLRPLIYRIALPGL